MDLLSTIAGSLMEGFLPAGWDLKKIDACVDPDPGRLTRAAAWLASAISSRSLCQSLADFETLAGARDRARRSSAAATRARKLILILPVGPMGMYRWVVYFLTEWGVPCDHVHGFNMDEWSDADGKSLPASDPGSFEQAMEAAFYGPLGKLHGAAESARLRHPETCCRITPSESARCGQQGAKLAVIFGIGRVCHIAFWEPHFAGRVRQRSRVETADASAGREAASADDRAERHHQLQEPHDARAGLRQHDRPGTFLGADKIIGGCDGTFGRGMMWQGLSVWMTLRHEPTPWIPSTYMPTQPGRLFILQELAGPLVAECN